MADDNELSSDEIITCVVEIATGKFITDGRPLVPGLMRVAIPRNPDPINERYTGDPANPIRPTTEKERLAEPIREAAAAADTFVLNPAQRALIIWIAQLHQLTFEDAQRQLRIIYRKLVE